MDGNVSRWPGVNTYVQITIGLTPEEVQTLRSYALETMGYDGEVDTRIMLQDFAANVCHQALKYIELEQVYIPRLG